MENFKTYFFFLVCFASDVPATTRKCSVKKCMPSKYQNWNEPVEEILFLNKLDLVIHPSKRSKKLLDKKRIFKVSKLPLDKKIFSNILHLKTYQMLFVQNIVFNGLPLKRPKNLDVKKRIGENLSKNPKMSVVFNIPPSKRPKTIIVKKRVFDIFPSKRLNFGSAPENYLRKNMYQKKMNHHNRQFLKTMFFIKMERF